MPSAPPLILANANAGGGTALSDVRAAADALASPALLRVTDSPEAARSALRTHWADGTRRFVAAGGDGTLHLLVNALYEMDVLTQVDAVGLAPVGTGNDLAGTLNLPDALPAALRTACTAPPRPLDALAVQRNDTTERLALNVCTGGFGGYIDKALSQGPKSLLGPLAYMMGAAQVLPKLRRYDVTLTLDDHTVSRSDLLNVVVANAPTAAGGLQVAPDADPFDGLLNVVTVSGRHGLGGYRRRAHRAHRALHRPCAGRSAHRPYRAHRQRPATYLQRRRRTVVVCARIIRGAAWSGAHGLPRAVAASTSLPCTCFCVFTPCALQA